MRISDWSSDVCSSDLAGLIHARLRSATRTRLPLLQQLHFDRTVARPLRGSALAVAPAVRQREIDRRAHRRHLRSVALLGRRAGTVGIDLGRSEEHTSELQSLMRISYAVLCLKQKKNPR